VGLAHSINGANAPSIRSGTHEDLLGVFVGWSRQDFCLRSYSFSFKHLYAL
jgi:hypothetical protein